jgi:hypothetical protein
MIEHSHVSEAELQDAIRRDLLQIVHASGVFRAVYPAMPVALATEGLEVLAWSVGVEREIPVSVAFAFRAWDCVIGQPVWLVLELDVFEVGCFGEEHFGCLFSKMI